MHICTRCGHDNVADATFCRECGAVLDWQREVEPDVARPSTPGDGGLFVAVPPRNQRVERGARRRKLALAASLSETDLAVDPGEDTTCEVRVRNQGTVVDRVAIEVIGPASRWVSCDPESLNLYPDADGTVALRFSPPRAPEPAAGPAPFEVRVTSSQDPSVVVAGHGTIVVSPFLDVAGELVPSVGQGGRRAVYRLSVTNRGNRAVQLDVRARDPDERLELVVHDPLLVCEPGASVTTSIVVRAPRLAITSPPPRQRFTVTAVEADRDGAALYQADAAFQQKRLLPKPVLTGLLSLLALVLLAGLAMALFGGDGDVTVPALAGQTRDGAEAQLREADLTLGDVTGQESGEPPGTVLDQQPPAGTTVERGTAVDVSVAVPADGGVVVVPDLRGRSRADAEDLLVAQGLLLGQVVEQPSPATEDTVLAQDPEAGTNVRAGVPVTIAVAVPEEVDTVAVPDVVGGVLEAARSRIEDAGLRVGAVTEAPSNEATGTVIAQDPQPDTDVDPDTPVDLEVAVRVVSSGVDVLHGTFSFDFDAGSEAPQQQGADLFWQQESQTERRLRPLGQAQVANLGRVNFDDVGLADLQAAALSNDPVEGSDGNDQMPAGTVLAVRTNAGNLAKVLIAARDVPSSDGRASIQNIRIEWMTFEPPQ